MSQACLVDTTKCIGCRSCQVACKQWNSLPAEQTRFHGLGGGYENPREYSSQTYTRVAFHEIMDDNDNLERCAYAKRQCMHCDDAACVAACPVAALRKTESGAVVYDAHKCMGCRYCMLACPFNVPTLEWDRLAPYIKKCTFCSDRIDDTDTSTVTVNDEPLSGAPLTRYREQQRTPACAKACPTGAIKFGDRDELLAEADSRMADHNRKPNTSWKYVGGVYGRHEVGGTNWIYISHVPFATLGFPMNLGDQSYPSYTSTALNSIPLAVIGVGVVLGGVYWATKRREEVAAAAVQGVTEHDS